LAEDGRARAKRTTRDEKRVIASMGRSVDGSESETREDEKELTQTTVISGSFSFSLRQVVRVKSGMYYFIYLSDKNSSKYHCPIIITEETVQSKNVLP